MNRGWESGQSILLSHRSGWTNHAVQETGGGVIEAVQSLRKFVDESVFMDSAF